MEPFHLREKTACLVFCSLLLTSCVSVNRLNQSLEQQTIDIETIRAIKPFAHISLPSGIKVDSVFAPKGFPKETFSYKTGGLVLPLLFYWHFQSNFMITLGNREFTQPVHEAFRERFKCLLTSCQDSSTVAQPYTLTMELQSCQVEGIYVNGTWASIYFYGSSSGEINHGRNSSAIIRVRWEMSKGSEPVTAGDVFVILKDAYLAPVAGYMTHHGKRTELSKSNLNYEVPFQINFKPDPYLNKNHSLQMVQTMCLGLDKASEMILTDLRDYFKNNPY